MSEDEDDEDDDVGGVGDGRLALDVLEPVDEDEEEDEPPVLIGVAAVELDDVDVLNVLGRFSFEMSVLDVGGCGGGAVEIGVDGVIKVAVVAVVVVVDVLGVC